MGRMELVTGEKPTNKTGGVDSPPEYDDVGEETI